MTKQLPLTQRQVRALCEGAKKAGYAPIVEIGNVLVWLVPMDHAIRAQELSSVDDDENPEAFTSLDQYRAWKERRRARGD